jgi:CheY-like chemotaxis protein
LRPAQAGWCVAKGFIVPTILVADDNSNIQKMVSLVFQEKGIKVVAVGNGEAACRKVPEVKPDIVLADVFMPVRNGYEVCEFVKRDSRFSETPVILLVGAFDPLDEKEARRVGADGVLKKPFVPPEPLIAMVSSLLQKAGKTEEVPVEVPAIETPPPPPVVAVMPALPTPPPREYRATPEPEPQEDEVAYGTASRDSDLADVVTTTVREPVATPFAVREEEQEDNTESASDWKRRREAMEYSIPEEESANLVDHLAEGNSGSAATKEEAKETEAEPAPLAKQFESAASESAAVERPHVSPSEWMDYMAPAEAETAAPAAVTSEADDAAPLAEASETESVSSAEVVSETAAPAREIVSEVPVQEETAQPIEAASSQNQMEEHSPAPEVHASSPADVIPFPVSAEQQSAAEPSAEVSSPAEEAPAPEPAYAADEVPVAQAAVEQAVQEVIAQPESAKQAPMDQATIDSIVARVVEKLEPQLHQALSQGVLRPLIQELLKGELKTDK